LFTILTCEDTQRLQEALDEGVLPSSKHLTRLTEVRGFDPADPVVELAAGYALWTALTKSGKVYVCGTGFDGYAGLLPTSVEHQGWQKINEVSPHAPA
jgi:alpha-tubulin suppressor-like RCC1 family protein